MSLTQVATKSEIPPETMRSVQVGESLILVAHCGNDFYAVSDVCTHMGGDLSSGVLEGTVVTCPRHGSRFDVRTGANMSGPKTSTTKPPDLRSYPVVIEGEAIKVDV
jgi:3-phenylpropionate/trans-cinnamate dioxygenase ferredoxin subunit